LMWLGGMHRHFTYFTSSLPPFNIHGLGSDVSWNGPRMFADARVRLTTMRA
jgi:hypothetical protein